MATYFPSPSNQRYTFLAPFIGDQKFASHSEPSFHPGNIMMYLNQASSASYSDILSCSSPPHNCDESLGGRNEMMFIPPIGDSVSLRSINGQLNPVTGHPLGSSVTGDSLVIFRTHLRVPNGEQNVQCQGLSLSLGTEIPSGVSVASFGNQYTNPGLSSFMNSSLPMSRKWGTSYKGDGSNEFRELRTAECLPSAFSGAQQNNNETETLCNPHSSVSTKEVVSYRFLYEPTGFTNTMLNSKYLRGAQQLLDEVVNVRKALKQRGLNKHQNIQGSGLDGSEEADGRSNSQSAPMSSDPVKSTTNSSCELSPAEQQDLQDKRTKFLSMLEELGPGQLNHTLHLRFRCLRDAIIGQIQVTQRSLEEQDTSPYGQGAGIPRLRYVDQQLRQKRALQQFGVMRHAWRPQRGLPERSVSILRAWLFEHFLHPYPKDSEKIMLARQTGLTRNQVANWFINARVRLWKPMVEEMYKEKFGESEMNSQSSPEKATKATRYNSGVFEERKEELQDNMISTTTDRFHLVQAHKTKFVDVEINGQTRSIGYDSSAHRDNISACGITKLQGDQGRSAEDCSIYSDEIIPIHHGGGGNLVAAAATYDMSELGNFVDGSQVSLALELRHCERDGFQMSGGTDIRGNNTETSSAEPDTVDFQCLDLGQQHHRFDSSQMLHDFVV